MQEILDQLWSDIGPIPGRLNPDRFISYWLSNFFVPKLLQYLRSRDLPTTLVGNPMNCLNTTNCQLILKAGIIFLNKIEVIYFPNSGTSFYRMTNSYLEKRPDFYLGRILSMFQEKFYQNLDFWGSMNVQAHEKEIVGQYFQGLYSDPFYMPFCIKTAFKLIPGNYSMFFDLIKHSQIGDTMPSLRERVDFEEKYIYNPEFWFGLKPSRPQYLNKQIGKIPFCEIAPNYEMRKMWGKEPLKCNYFKKTITAKGLCHTFNAQSMGSIYKTMPIVDIWNSRLNLQEKVTILKPDGYGQNYGLNFLLNSFTTEAFNRTTTNFLLSITNDNNPFDIFKQNFKIEPGMSYTFKIVPSQMISTDRFNDMEDNIREHSYLLSHS